MLTSCEICSKEIEINKFQSHIFEEHNLLFSQYIGLISSKVNFKDYVIWKQLKKERKKKQK